MRRLLAIALFLGCINPPPPSEIALDPEMTDLQVAITQDAMEQWCREVTWCPRVTPMAKNRVVLETHAEFLKHNLEVDAYAMNSNAWGGDGNIYIDSWHPRAIDPDWFFTLIAHELGHYGIEGHSVETTTLMGLTPDMIFELDSQAIKAWCEEQGDC